MPVPTSLRAIARRVALPVLTAILAGCAAPPPAPAPVARPKPEHPLPEAVRQALAQRFPDLKIVSDSSGLLPTPDVDDIAVVLKRGDISGEYFVALVAPDGHGAWRVAEASQPIVPGCGKCSVSADLAPHGLYVRVIRAQGQDFENFTYQFAPGAANEPWRLVNVTAYVPPRPEDPASHGFSASVDLLTGQRTDIVDEAGGDGALHREHQTAVPLRAAIAFEDFSFAPDALDAETRKLPPVVFDPSGTLPAAAVDALREHFPKMTVQSQAGGTLRGEGRDIAVVLVPADRAARMGAASDALVAVLLAQPDGGVKLAEVSGAMAHDCPTCDVQVQIARRTLRVQTTDVNATGSVSVDYQFAFRPKDPSLRLVGLRTETTRRAGDAGSRHTLASTNLITGEHVETVDAIVNGRRTHNEQKTRVTPGEPLPLSQFAFDPGALADAAPAATTAAESVSGS
jgi:hypothetical protein